MTEKILKRFERAKIAAMLSVHKKRMGAVIYRHGIPISIGWNSRKTHARSKSYGYLQHAEFSALIGVTKSILVSSEIYVIRLHLDGTWGHSRPCQDCQELLLEAGIKRAWFININGNIESMRIR